MRSTFDGVIGGKYSIAIPARDFHSKRDELETFYGRRLLTYSHCLTLDFRSYLVVFFQEKADADLAIRSFDGEPFDVRDKGRGSKWMFWFEGRSIVYDILAGSGIAPFSNILRNGGGSKNCEPP